MPALSVTEVFAQFDPARLSQICASPQLFAEAFFAVPDTGEPFRANYTQRRVFASSSRRVVLRVSRRAGKSYALAVLALYHALTQRNCRVLLVCPYASQVKAIFTVIRNFIRANPWIEGERTRDREAPQQRLEFTNGAYIAGFTSGARQKSGAASIRGQGADVLLLDEAHYFDIGDWEAITPIMDGDPNHPAPFVYMASTPASQRGYYYEACKELKDLWDEIHVPVTENPDVPPEKAAQIRRSVDLLTWLKEWMAEFPDIGEGVFPEKLLKNPKVRREIHYSKALVNAEKSVDETGRHPTRTIGVDWDKHGAGSTITVLEALPRNRYRLIYTEEVAQGEYTLTNAVQRVIQLNAVFDPDWIFIDQGNGDYQLEELQKHGKKFRNSKLAERVVGYRFENIIETPLPVGGLMRKSFKESAVSLLRKWFEDETLEIPQKEQDPVLDKELREYHVKRQSDRGTVYSDDNDHRIAALELAAMAMHLKVQNPYAAEPATVSYNLQVPVAVPAELLYEQHPERRTIGMSGRDPQTYATENRTTSFQRSQLGDLGPLTRRSF